MEQLWSRWHALAESGAERAAGGGEYRPSVLRAYRGAWERLSPRIGNVKAHELRTPRVQAIIGELQAEGLAPSTISNTITPLRVVMAWAVRSEVVPANPCAGRVLRFPSGEVARDRIASPSEALELIQALPRVEDRALYATACFGGLRRGELMGLRWSDVDLSERTIRVERSYDPASQRFLPPKTKKGRRTLGIPQLLVPFLAALDNTEGLVFPSERGSPFSPFRVRTRALEAWKAAGLEPLGLHECRHSYASTMIAAGVPIKVISEAMGHASVGITWDRYGHLLKDSRTHAMELYDSYLARYTAPQSIA
jgi:integrase